MVGKFFELDYDTRYISIIIEFEYNSKKSQGVPNAVRETFLGICPPEFPNGRGGPNVPKEIKNFTGYGEDGHNRDVINPIHFALIKNPIKIELGGGRFRTRNTATGAIILYDYLGLLDDYETVCLKFEKFLQETHEKQKPKHWASVTNIQLIVGYDLRDVAK